MKRLVFFDAYVDSYEITSRLATLRSRPGVKDVRLLATTEGTPRYCIELDVDPAEDAAVWQAIKSEMAEYPEYVANVSTRAYRVLA